MIKRCTLPGESLLQRYVAGGDYTDCFTTDIALDVSHARFVSAFYTTPVFRLERLILSVVVSRPSSDEQAHDLATGAIDHFAAWRVEARAENQLLLVDYSGSTRSWLMVTAADSAAGVGTRLLFGSAVIASKVGTGGERRMSRRFGALLGAHRIYSRILLGAARRRLLARGGETLSA